MKNTLLIAFAILITVSAASAKSFNNGATAPVKEDALVFDLGKTEATLKTNLHADMYAANTAIHNKQCYPVQLVKAMKSELLSNENLAKDAAHIVYGYNNRTLVVKWINGTWMVSYLKKSLEETGSKTYVYSLAPLPKPKAKK